jgi:hypothetical protein
LSGISTNITKDLREGTFIKHRPEKRGNFQSSIFGSVVGENISLSA